MEVIMHLHIEEKYSAVIFHLKGKLMGGNDAKIMGENINNLINEGKRQVIVDMSGLRFVNSTGLGILISNYTTLKKRGGDLKLAAIDDKVSGVLSLTKLNQIFSAYNTVEEALRSIN